MKTSSLVLILASVLLLCACASIPTGPSVMVLPGDGKNFEQFQVDDSICRQWAAQQTGTNTDKVTTDSALSGATIGTLLGAAAGAALGAAAGNPAVGAAAGAGVGLLGGTAVGANRGNAGALSVQSRYDTTYMQCMYAKGNQIPVARGSQPAGFSRSQPPPPPPPPPTTNTPPPPAGAPPPPPPGPTR